MERLRRWVHHTARKWTWVAAGFSLGSRLKSRMCPKGSEKAVRHTGKGRERQWKVEERQGRTDVEHVKQVPEHEIDRSA